MPEEKMRMSGQLVRERADGTIEVRCPRCGMWQPQGDYYAYTNTPRYTMDLAHILRCCAQDDRGEPCSHVFAPVQLYMKMRTEILAGVQTE